MTAARPHPTGLAQTASQAAAHCAAHDDLRAFEGELISLIPHMRAFARSLCKDATSADDLAQDALAQAWQANPNSPA
jgi:DNA-directed RNA polymerase specialized sigma24 family protein